jgi:hypothetical protein
VLHLHRFEDHQRRALLDAIAGGDHHRHDSAGHRRHQVAAVGLLDAGVRQRVREHERRVRAEGEDVPGLAVGDDRRGELAGPGIDRQPAVALAHRRDRRGGCAGGVDRHAPAPAVARDGDATRRLAVDEGERERVPVAVRPPGIDFAPRRMRVPGGGRGVGARGDEREGLAEGGGEQHIRRRRRGGRKQRGVVSRDQAGVEPRGGEGLVGDNALQEGDVARHTGDLVARERLREASQRGRPIVAVDDQLGDHRVVERRDLIALAHAGVHAHRGAFRRRAQMDEATDRRQEPALGILGVDPRLDRMAADCECVLRERQSLAGRDAQLPLHQVDAGDHLGHRMLDLQPGVHLHEVERAVLLGDELDGAGADVADRLGRGDRGLAHRTAPPGRHAGRRRLLQHLLMAALHRAVALEEIDCVAVRIAEHLDLDVPRRGQVLLQQHPVVAEGGLGLALRRGERRGEVLRTLDDLHSLAAAAGGRLDQHGKADALALAREQRRILAIAVVARHQRHARRAHDRLGRRLRAHRRDRRGRRADEHDAGRGTG